MPLRTPRLFSNRTGNVAITTALCFPFVISALALGVDYGYLTLQQRQLQSTADLSAISASATPSSPESGVLDFMNLNSLNIAVLKNGQLLNNKGAPVAFDAATVFDRFEAYAEVVNGHYQADSSVPVTSRFQPATAPYDAVRVTLHQRGGLFFGGSITKAPTLSANGLASIDRMASFSVGSRLASLDGGIVNALLGNLLGTTISLSVMDYQALVNANVDLLKVFEQLAIKLNLTAGTYDDLLNTDIAYGTLLNAIGQTTGVTPAVSTILKTLEKTVEKTKLTVKLKDFMDIGPLGSRLIGQSNGLAAQADIFELISATARTATGSQQIDLDLGATVPGLAAVTVSLAIGEPPQNAKAFGIGRTGSTLRTAQTRVAITASVDGITGLLGIRVKVPLYLEVAHAEARMAAITCSSGSPGATVAVEAAPGVLELSLGDVDKSAFANFGKDPRVTKTKMVATPALNINALAYTNATNMNLSRVSFSPSDISGKKIKQVSTSNTVSTLTDSLIRDLQLEVEVLGIRVAVPSAILSGLADTLKLLTVPLDKVLYSLLSTLGVKIGEADIRVGGATCQNPVLVQ